MEIIDKSFTKAPGHYIVQSLLALAVLTIILYFVEVLTQAAIVAALGASTFIVFAMPRSITAQPRRLVGGHAVGIICGLNATTFSLSVLFQSWPLTGNSSPGLPMPYQWGFLCS